MLNYGKLSKILEAVFFFRSGLCIINDLKNREVQKRERETKKKKLFKPDLFPDVYCPFEFLSTFSLRPLTTFYCCSLFQFSVFLKENILLCIFTKQNVENWKHAPCASDEPLLLKSEAQLGIFPMLKQITDTSQLKNRKGLLSWLITLETVMRQHNAAIVSGRVSCSLHGRQEEKRKSSEGTESSMPFQGHVPNDLTSSQ